LQGDNADAANGTAFTLQEKTLGLDEHFTLGAQGRSSERSVPMLAIDGPHHEFYVAFMWSGAWNLTVDSVAAGLSLSLGLTPMTTVVATDPLDGPHVLFGAPPAASHRRRSPFSFRNEGFAAIDLSAMAAEIAIYKALRGTLDVASASLLSLQAAGVDGPGWDILQETTADRERLLLSVVRSDAGGNRVTVRPIGLGPKETYDVYSVDTGALGSALGADLMQSGIEVLNGPATAAHILILTKNR
jgi:hypothetical protein